MVKRQPALLLSKSPNSQKVLAKLALGLLLITFFLASEIILPSPLFATGVYAQEAQTPSSIATPTPDTTPITWQLPFSGYLSQSFTAYHPGVDIATGLGMPIKPIAKGVVTKTGYDFWGYGLKVEIDHPNGYHTLYAHLGKIYVQVGQTVDLNDYIGEVGLTGRTTGPHTHIEVYKDSVRINPLTVLPDVRKFPQPEDFVQQGNPTPPIIESTSSAQIATDEAKPIEYYQPTPTPTPTPLSPADVSLTTSKNQPLLDSLRLTPTKEITSTKTDELKITENLVRPEDAKETVTASSFQGGSILTLPTINTPSTEKTTSSTSLSDQTVKKMDLSTLFSKTTTIGEQKTKTTSPLSLLLP